MHLDLSSTPPATINQHVAHLCGWRRKVRTGEICVEQQLDKDVGLLRTVVTDYVVTTDNILWTELLDDLGGRSRGENTARKRRGKVLIHEANYH
jgi:hypothetical protein